MIIPPWVDSAIAGSRYGILPGVHSAALGIHGLSQTYREGVHGILWRPIWDPRLKKLGTDAILHYIVFVIPPTT